MLDDFLPQPRLRELDTVEVGVPVAEAFRAISTLDLGALPIARALFEARAIPERLAGKHPEPWDLRLETILSSTHGFRLLATEPERGFVVGAIGAVWESSIPFVDVEPAAYRDYAEPGQAKVAWELRVDPLTAASSRISFEVRVTATDEESWARFRRYFALIGPFSHLIRRMMLANVAKGLGKPDAIESVQVLAGDSLIPAPLGSHTDAVTIEAPPSAVWPWLVQMGADRGGWYAIDLLDHANAPSAREIDPALSQLAVGDVLAAMPGDGGGFTVAEIVPERALVLYGAWDLQTDRALALGEAMPPEHWQVSWAFALEPTGTGGTRLLVRVRGHWAPERLVWRARIGLLTHHVMEHAQLAHLKARAEGTLRRDTASEVLEGLGGAARILLTLCTPWLRDERAHWGLDASLAARAYPGDERVPSPRWSWTHGIEVDASPAEVWPWLAQVGADRGGFYSYQFLENLGGCDLRNADRIHTEWQRTAVGEGALAMHPGIPALPIVELEPGRHFVAFGAANDEDPMKVSVSWLFLVEPLEADRSRIVSRFRAAYADTLAASLAMGPAITEPIGFVMDRRMLLGLKERTERARRERDRHG